MHACDNSQTDGCAQPAYACVKNGDETEFYCPAHFEESLHAYLVGNDTITFDRVVPGVDGLPTWKTS
jgi:hypothetical protein